MGRSELLELAAETLDILAGLNRARQQPRVLSRVVKVVALTIIHPSPIEKKIDFCRRGKGLVDVLDTWIIGKHSAQVGLSVFLPEQIISGGDHPNMIP